MTPNEYDSAVELQLDLMRASAGISRDVLRVLLRMERELAVKVGGEDLAAATKKRLNAQLVEVKARIKEYYAEASGVAAAGVSAISEVTAAVTASVLPGSVLPTQTVLERIAASSVIQGAPQAEWWARQSADTAFRFANTVRQGVASGETNQQIISKVRAFLDTSRANAAALVQTSVATVGNDARQAVFEANSDIIKKYRAVATLDTHTCERCAPLDGLEWNPDGSAIKHKYPKPRYPLHFNCRCLLLPVVFDGEPGGMRASADGPVSAKLTFSGWLERQSKAKQQEVLGKGRAELYRAGKITLSDLVSGNGKPLTIDQLKAKYK
jgi:SPP1 gp7 family putative phage head morphogenesis protein